MKAPEKPSCEAARLNALRCLNLLDSEAEERFDRLTRLARNLFDVPIAVVSLVDEDRQWFKSKQGLDAPETSREVSFCGHTIIKPEIMVIKDTFTDERFSDNPLVTDAPNIRFYAGYPLEPKEGLRIGTLCIIDSKPREFGVNQKLLLTDLGEMVEAELFKASLATTDELTGLSNRRGFVEISEYILQQAKRQDVPITLFYIDLDKFKEINDTYGHQAGDEALIATSEILLETFREMDIVGRLGGDEFCVLCTELQKPKIKSVEKRLNQAFDQFNQKSQKPWKLLYSIGSVCIDPNNHDNFEALLHKADEKMYKCKQNNKKEAG